MRFVATPIDGVQVIEAEPHSDERGTFSRIYCADEFRAHGLELPDRQFAISQNRLAGTLRGLHYIVAAQGEAKLVRCVRGRVFDVAVDVRRDSRTFGRHFAIELNVERPRALYIPRGVAHGFLTLEAESDILYQFSQPYRAGLEAGVRWNDPTINIQWPREPAILSERDSALPWLTDVTE
ncbi:MAG TPA: dTDP-4-dehydrorhamnose 3,5-epimerase [Povalibacter sp.]|nr:dTDP-4-dehydrorhamnose 3,5-epimerase [Povalibacter sp.]